MIHDGTGSVWGSTCWYLVAMDQYKAVMVDPRWYWVSIGRYWLVLGGTGSVDGGTRSPRKFDLYQTPATFLNFFSRA